MVEQFVKYRTKHFQMHKQMLELLNKPVSERLRVSEELTSVCSYPFFGVDDVLPHEVLGNRRHIRRVGQNHLLQGHARLLVARVMFDVGADHEARQHLILVGKKEPTTSQSGEQ